MLESWDKLKEYEFECDRESGQCHPGKVSPGQLQKLVLTEAGGDLLCMCGKETSFKPKVHTKPPLPNRRIHLQQRLFLFILV